MNESCAIIEDGPGCRAKSKGSIEEFWLAGRTDLVSNMQRT